MVLGILELPVKDLESLSCSGKDLSPLECQYGNTLLTRTIAGNYTKSCKKVKTFPVFD